MIRLSIVVPLPDHRGQALEAISSWCEQTLARDEYEIVVIIDRREREIEEAVAALLAPHDQLVTVAGGTLHDCYNAGARAARGEWLLCTESHVKAAPDCCEQILARMAEGDVDLAAVASGGIDESRFAGQEQIIYEEALAERIAGGWNLCTVRGFAASRAAFERAGGFQSRYGHMAELLLGAMLKHQGCRLGYAPLARVWHFNSGAMEHFARELSGFGRDEIRFRAEQPDSPLVAYLGPCPMWEEREKCRRGAALGEVLGGFARAGSALASGNLKQFGRSLEEAIRYVPHVLLGPAWLEWKAAFAVWWAIALLYLCHFADGWYYSAFRAFWNGEIRLGRAAAVVEHLSEAARPVAREAGVPA